MNREGGFVRLMEDNMTDQSAPGAYMKVCSFMVVSDAGDSRMV